VFKVDQSYKKYWMVSYMQRYMEVFMCNHVAHIELRCTEQEVCNVILSISDHSSKFIGFIKAKTYSPVLKRMISRAIFFLIIFFPPMARCVLEPLTSFWFYTNITKS